MPASWETDGLSIAKDRSCSSAQSVTISAARSTRAMCQTTTTSPRENIPTIDRQPGRMPPYYNTTGNCTNGGDNAEYPDINPGTLWPMNYIAIEGNDTTFLPFAACCPTPVKFTPPCVLYCDTDSTGDSGSMGKCWQAHGFNPYSSFGSGGSAPQRATMPVIIGSVIGSVAFIALLVGFWHRWAGNRASKGKSTLPNERNSEQNSTLHATDGTHSHDYETVKYDLKLGLLEDDTKYNIMVKQTNPPSTDSRRRS